MIHAVRATLSSRLLTGAAITLTAGLVLWQVAPGPFSRTGREFRPASVPSPAKKVSPVPLPPAQTFDHRVLPADANGLVQIPELIQQSLRLNASDSAIQDDLEILDVLLESFRTSNGGAPPISGENEEVVAQWRGQNPHRLAFLPEHHPAINARGQLLDRWGTPFYFHPASRTQWEIRSAGPDRKLFTADDVHN